MDTSAIFLGYSVRKLRQLSERVEDCLSRLNDEQIWARGSKNENAVGNLILHLSGNVRQWIVSAVGRQTDVRQRDGEFAAREIPANVLREQFRESVEQAAAVLEMLAPGRLTEHVHPQNYDVTVLEAIYHVVEHFSGHTGQILFATKLLTGEDLGYYQHLQAGVHSQPTP